MLKTTGWALSDDSGLQNLSPAWWALSSLGRLYGRGCQIGSSLRTEGAGQRHLNTTEILNAMEYICICTMIQEDFSKNVEIYVPCMSYAFLIPYWALLEVWLGTSQNRQGLDKSFPVANFGKCLQGDQSSGGEELNAAIKSLLWKGTVGSFPTLLTVQNSISFMLLICWLGVACHSQHCCQKQMYMVTFITPFFVPLWISICLQNLFYKWHKCARNITAGKIWQQ